MPNITFSQKENQTILNCNLLLHLWHPELSERIQWHREDGSIHISENNDLPYEEDIMALLIHCDDFQKLIAKRLTSFTELTSQSLRQLYEKSQTLHGMRLLLNNYQRIIIGKAVHCISLLRGASATDETPYAPMARLKLGEDLLNVLQDGQKQLATLARIQQRVLSKMHVVTFQITTELNEVSESQPGYLLLPRQVEIGQFMHSDNPINIRAHLMVESAALSNPSTPLLADLTTIQFHLQSEAIPVLLMAYPRWSTEINVPSITLTEFRACPGGARDRLARFTTASSVGALPYETPYLATTLCGPFAEDNQRPMLPYYFQAMVEIAKAHHCYQVVCFIPFDFTLIAHAMGFYSNNMEENAWCENELYQAIINNKAPELLTDTENHFEGDEELCRPVFFPLSEIATRTVHLASELGSRVTTYAKEIEKTALFNNTHGEGILPDPYGFLAKPVCSFFHAIRKQSLTGKPLRKISSTSQTEEADYAWLADEQALLSIGESTHLQPDDRTIVARILK